MDNHSDFMSHEIKRLGINLETLPGTLKFLKHLVPSLESTISSLQDQVAQINAALDNSKIIDRHLIKQGWFIHDLYSMDIITTISEKCKIKDYQSAEEVLCDFWLDDLGGFNQINLHMKNVQFDIKFDPRSDKRIRQQSKNIHVAKSGSESKYEEDYEKNNMYSDMIWKAYQSVRNERYSECVLLLLPVIDGITSKFFVDLGNDKGTIFASKTRQKITDETKKALKLIAPNLWEVLNVIGENRGSYNAEEITIPYRNGIVHGMDTNFDNKFTACKCWSLLFGIHRVTKMIREFKDVKTVKNKTQIQQMAESHQIEKDLTTFRSRTKLKITDDGNFETQNFDEKSPEYALQKFLIAWKQRNYKQMAILTSDVTRSMNIIERQRKTLASSIKEIKKDMSKYDLVSCCYTEEIDEALSMTTISCDLKFDVKNYDDEFSVDTKFDFALFCEEDKFYEPVSRHDNNAKWLLRPNYPFELNNVATNQWFKLVQSK